jgi:hypothetical protein
MPFKRTMILTCVALLFGTSCFLNLEASSAAGSSSKVDGNLDTNTPARQLQYSGGSSRYMIWDFSGNVPRQDVRGERSNEMYGSSVSIWDQYMVIGASGDASREKASGSVYVYSKQEEDGDHFWELLEVVEPWDGEEGDKFGCAVDLHFYTLVIGASMHDDGGDDTGAAYIYECYNNADDNDAEEREDREGEEREGEDRGEEGRRRVEGMERMWYLAAKLQPEDRQSQDYFGSAVATQGNLTAVGAYGSDARATFSGAVYLWHKIWTFNKEAQQPWEWVYYQKLSASDGARYDVFGSSLAIYDDKLAVGATGVDSDSHIAVGAVYVYIQSLDDNSEFGKSFQVVDKLTPGSLGGYYDHFGQSVAIWGYNVIVGAPNTQVNDTVNAGAFYSYEFNEYNQINFIEKITPYDPSTGARCGYSVDIYHDLAAVGCSDATGMGSVYMYTEVSSLSTPSTINTHWLYEAHKSLSSQAAGDMFGHTVSVYDDTVAVGAYGVSSSVGAVYAYIGGKKTYQDSFEEEVDDDDDDEEITEEEEEKKKGYDDDLREALYEIEESPREAKMVVLVLFLVVLVAIVYYDKRKKILLAKQQFDDSQHSPSTQYELAGMNSSHGTASSSSSATSRNPFITSPPAITNRPDTSYHPKPTAPTTPATSYAYTPTPAPVQGSSQRVRDLAAAGLLARPSGSSHSHSSNSSQSSRARPLASPVFSPLVTSSSNYVSRQRPDDAAQ